MKMKAQHIKNKTHQKQSRREFYSNKLLCKKQKDFKEGNQDKTYATREVTQNQAHISRRKETAKIKAERNEVETEKNQ
jgi:hypothetical protein